MTKAFFVYIITNKKFGVMYTGVTSDLPKRVFEHKSKSVTGFSSRYNLSMLVYYERHDAAEAAITREKQIKKWRRMWKIDLVEKFNPAWNDLYDVITQ